MTVSSYSMQLAWDKLRRIWHIDKQRFGMGNGVGNTVVFTFWEHDWNDLLIPYVDGIALYELFILSNWDTQDNPVGTYISRIVRQSKTPDYVLGHKLRFVYTVVDLSNGPVEL